MRSTLGLLAKKLGQSKRDAVTRNSSLTEKPSSTRMKVWIAKV